MTSYNATARDVTRDSLSQQDLRVLLDNAPDAIGRFDRNLRHVYVNHATAEANGRPASEFYGKTMEELGHPPEICRIINDGLRQVFATACESTTELLFAGPNGPVWYQSRMAPEYGSDGSVEYVLVVSRDVSQHRRLEAQLRDVENRAAVANLSSQLAHDIHNPLTAVTNAVYLLKHNPSLDSNARQLVQLISEQLDRVTEISKHSLLLGYQAGEEKK